MERKEEKEMLKTLFHGNDEGFSFGIVILIIFSVSMLVLGLDLFLTQKNLLIEKEYVDMQKKIEKRNIEEKFLYESL